MAASAEKIKELLGNGLSNEVVATAVGVHPSYISQLMADEDFSAEVVSLRTKQLTAATSRDRSWDGVEDKLLDKLSEVVDMGMIYKPTEVLRALAIVNNAKRRGVSQQQAMVVNQQIVTLVLPEVVVKSFSRNSVNEVVEVDGQTLVTMPASTLMQNLANGNKGRKDYEQVRRYLPQNLGTETS